MNCTEAEMKMFENRVLLNKYNEITSMIMEIMCEDKKAEREKDVVKLCGIMLETHHQILELMDRGIEK